MYAFDTYDNAQQYLNMHCTGLNSMGVSKVNAKYFDINKSLTTITNGRID
ncbi:YdhR family protein [Staphylococcus saprophyticus]